MVNERDPAGMAILEKAGAVITALEARGEASVSELADAVDEPVSSTYRLLANLTALGWVDPGLKRGRYRLGLYFIRIGGLLEDRLDIRGACGPALEALHEETRETSFLCFRRGDYAVCVDRISGREVQSLAMRLGDALPLYQGAAPLALLAYLPNEERRAVLDRFARRRAEGAPIPEEAALRDQIEATRERGYSLSDEDVTVGVAAIGAPVFNHRGELEGAISLSGLRDRILGPGVDAAAHVREAAEQSSRALGYLGVRA